MKTPLGTEVDIGAGHTVLDGFRALRERGTAPPSFRPMSIVATVAHLSYCWALVHLQTTKRIREIIATQVLQKYCKKFH